MRSLETLVRDNVALLRQGQDVLSGLDDATYTRTHPELALSGVGSHLRHTLDFYSRLLDGLATGEVDYDARARDLRLETEPSFAAEHAEFLIGRLESLSRARPATAARLNIKSDADGGGPGFAPWTASSLERELQATLSHTVHHYAIIAILLRLSGVDPGREFGVAPSTLRYWNAEAERACAQ